MMMRADFVLKMEFRTAVNIIFRVVIMWGKMPSADSVAE